MDLKNLVIIGTSHISRNSVRDVRKSIEKINPLIVCVELDKGRYLALKNKKKGESRRIGFKEISTLGFKGYLFVVVGAFIQKKLGNLVKTEPGSEMKEVINLSKEFDFKIALIDRDIRITLRRFSKAWKFRDTLRVLFEFIRGVFKPRKLKFDLKEVPSDKVIDELIDELKIKFPSVYEVLISERNVYMARKIAKLLKTYPDDKILAIVGAGHKSEIIKLLKFNFE